jgi:hypothetical protein
MRPLSRSYFNPLFNKNPFSELNYGTGKTVSEETIQDAKEPLKVKWHNDSFVKISILRN